MQYKERLTAPYSNNKYYKHTSAGGVNKCILIGEGSCLPNCVGYAWGRWYEILGEEPKLSRANAENWYNTNDGYERGQTPKVGAVMCWRGGTAGNANDGAGHVAIVEQVLDNGTVITSESSYGGARWESKRRVYPYNTPTNTFQGFIYLPVDIETQPTESTEQETEDINVTEQEAVDVIAKMVIAGRFGNGNARKEAIYRLIQNRVNELLV